MPGLGRAFRWFLEFEQAFTWLPTKKISRNFETRSLKAAQKPQASSRLRKQPLLPQRLAASETSASAGL